ncbi:MAG: hypothetical protein HN366_14895 [Deltaproteobacteria bacterium]|nr:hypothetical protein [Deltaproteobacteria bacterium]
MSIHRATKMNKFSAIIFFFGISVLAFASSSRADWINLTGAQSAPNIAEIYIEDDRIRLVLEIYVKDIANFIHLIPEDWIRKSGTELPPIEERMKRFSAETFQFITDDKDRLHAERILVEQRLRKDRSNPFAGTINPMTRQPVPGPPEDKRVLYADLIYPFKTKPKTLTIIPPLSKSGWPAVSIGFIVYQNGVPVVDYRFLPGSAKLHLDWDDPWYSKFESKALKRWQESGLMIYLYVEPYEVRNEILVRVKDLEQWMDLGLKGEQFIEVDEFEALKKKIGAFLLEHSKVLIDGKKLRPILDRVSFVKYTMTRTFFIDKPERMLLNTAMIGVIVTYLTKGIPQEVTVDWDLFSDKIRKVPTTAVDPAGPFPSYVTPEDHVLTWTNFLKTYKIPTVAEIAVDDSLTKIGVPVGSALCLVLLILLLWFTFRRRKHGGEIRLQIGFAVLLVTGCVLLYPFLRVPVVRPAVLTPKITDDKAMALLNNLLKNVYRAFDFREEDDVYDRLATSVHGDLLTDIYLQNRKSMVVTQAGGAQGKVKDIDILDVSVRHLNDRPLALVFHSKWTAMGAVGHWGHIHIRKNQYEANITMEPVDGVWKITDLELLEEKRIDPYGKQKPPKTGEP